MHSQPERRRGALRNFLAALHLMAPIPPGDGQDGFWAKNIHPVVEPEDHQAENRQEGDFDHTACAAALLMHEADDPSDGRLHHEPDERAAK